MFNNNSTKKNKTSTQSPALSTPQPQSIFYPISLPFYNYPPTQVPPLAPQSSTIIPSLGDKPVPTIQEFLENLDNLYGNQKFTCFLERFINESIDVLDIQVLTDNDFEKLGISNIGIKTKLVREAKKYSQ